MFILRRYARQVGVVAMMLFVILLSLSNTSSNGWFSKTLVADENHRAKENLIIVDGTKQPESPTVLGEWTPITFQKTPKSKSAGMPSAKLRFFEAVKRKKLTRPQKTKKRRPSKSTTLSTGTNTANSISALTSSKTDISSSRKQKTTMPTVMPKGWVYHGPKYKRCRVRTVGCYFQRTNFARQHPQFYRFEKSPDMTDWKCVSLCGSDTMSTFAGLRNGNECFCVSRADYIISLQESDQCNISCSGDSNLNCGGHNNITMVYHAMGKCIEASDERRIDVKDSVLGCYKKPSDSLDMEQYKMNEGFLTNQCLLLCEKKGLTLAVPLHTTRTCLCGHTTHRFDMSHPVNSSLCKKNKRKYVTVYRTWAEDRRCGDRRFLKEGEWTKSVALATFPGSGNTWLRHLIESATGIYTGSAYDDNLLFKAGQLGEFLPKTSKRAMVFKTHSYEDVGNDSMFDATIHIYRDPYDAIMSEYNRQHLHSHTKAVDASTFDVEALEVLATSRAALRWRRMTEKAIKSNKPSLIFSYESLVKDPIYWSERMARFILGNSVDENDLQNRLLCLRLAATGQFKRKKRPLNFDPYTKKGKEKINYEIKTMMDTMELYGYDQMQDYRRY